MKIASIDLGSNSALLLIAEISAEGKIIPLLEKCEVTRLGENLSNTHLLSDEAMKRNLEVLKKYTAFAHQHGVSQIYCITTEAMRRAKNGLLFADKIEKNCGFKVNIISGLEEAELAYLSAYKDFKNTYQNIVVLDIGGGSTELIWRKSASGGKAQIKTLSMKMGSVRLTEELIKNDPVTEAEFENLQHHIQLKIENDLEKLELPQAPLTLIGLAGTLTTLSQIDQGLSQFDSEKIQGAILTRHSLQKIILDLKCKTIIQRCEMIGMEPKRADVLLAGACILEAILKKFDLKHVVVSDRGIRYGLLHKMLKLITK